MARALKYAIAILACAAAAPGQAQTPAAPGATPAAAPTKVPPAPAARSTAAPTKAPKAAGAGPAAAPSAGAPPAGQTAEKLAPLPPENRPALKLEIDKKKGFVTGDLVHLSITAEAAKGDDVAVPEQNLGAFEVRAKRLQTEPIAGDRKRFKFEIDLLALEPGEHEVPPIELRVVTATGLIGSVSTQPLKIRVSSVLGNEPNAKPKPPSKPVSVMQEDYTLLYVLGGVLGAAAVALVTLLIARWWTRREKKLPLPPPPRPPWETAIERLAQLEREMPAMLQRAAGAEFVDRVSDILREYLGARFAPGLLVCDGLETTSSEMIQILREARMDVELLREIAEFLFRCDLVKFAKMVPDQKLAEEILAKARQTVQVSTPPPAPANPSSPTTPPDKNP